MALTTDELIALARAHAAAEAEDDNIDAVMATMQADPVFELQPMGVAFRGREATLQYYEYFFGTVKKLISGYELRAEWANEYGVAQEYTIDFRLPDGTEERHAVIGIFTFGEDALVGERLYGSDRLHELLFGPVLKLAQPL